MRPEVLDHEFLVKAREWLSDIRHWKKGGYGYGGPLSGTPERTCAIGALAYAMGEKIDKTEGSHAHMLLKQVAGVDVISFNDAKSTTHNMVLDLFDRAIAKAKELATAPQK